MGKDPECERPRREDYERALESMNSFIDIEVNDLMALAERAEHFAQQRLNESVNVTQIMSQPVRSVHADVTMAQAAHLMVTMRISGLPVIDEDDCLVGIITETDFLRALGVPIHQQATSIWQTLESLFSHLAHQADIEGPDDPVSKHMVSNVVCASPDQDVYEVIDLMKLHQVKRILVCDRQRHVVGMVTRSDLMRLFFDRYTQQAPAAQGGGD